MNVQDPWLSNNQSVLAAAVRDLRSWFSGTPPMAPPDPAYSGSALADVTALFKLSTFERDVLVMCAARELDAGFETVPSFGAALAVLPGAHWSATLPTAPLRWWRLVHPAPGQGLVAAPLRIDECILHALSGLPCTDEQLGAQLQRVPPTALVASQAAAAREVAEHWRNAPVQLYGPAGELPGIAAAAAAGLGLTLWSAPAALLLGSGADEWFRLWQRQAMLLQGALLIDCAGHEDLASLRAVATLMRQACTPLLLSHSRPVALPGLTLPRVEITRPSPAEQIILWQGAFGLSEATPAIERVAANFDFGAGAIAAVANTAGSVENLWATCRDQLRGEPARPSGAAPMRWDDLALPQRAETLLRDMAAQLRHRRTVHGDWGFPAAGSGITALFHGPSGTGKSLAAQVIADVLDLELCRIDLSQVVSKYIGETEKELSRLFDAAEASGAVLLFDEADALFGRRSEVRDSHDRYANQEVSYLLQRMESYRGLAILTTNMRDSIDTAFLRRIRFIIAFQHPGLEERIRLWRIALPPAAPCAKLDLARLAQVNLTGGQIRNVALGAAFLAADAGTPITMAQLLESARRECAKIDRPLTQAEIAGWVT